jgi:DNA-binding protein Fis
VLDDVEMSLVRQALAHSHGNQTKAAELLGISRDQLRYRLKKLQDPEHTATE